MFSPYAVKYPHTNTGVLPFLFPGYGGLLPPGFAAPHLPITGMYTDKEHVTYCILIIERVIVLLCMYLLLFHVTAHVLSVFFMTEAYL